MRANRAERTIKLSKQETVEVRANTGMGATIEAIMLDKAKALANELDEPIGGLDSEGNLLFRRYSDKKEGK